MPNEMMMFKDFAEKVNVGDEITFFPQDWEDFHYDLRKLMGETGLVTHKENVFDHSGKSEWRIFWHALNSPDMKWCWYESNFVPGKKQAHTVFLILKQGPGYIELTTGYDTGA